MEQYLGRTVKKKFKRYGVFTGTVKSYDSESGFFKIVYEDGDSEELDLSELVPLLVGAQFAEADLTRKSSCVARKPLKRRRVELAGNAAATDSGKGRNSDDFSSCFGKNRQENGGLDEETKNLDTELDLTLPRTANSSYEETLTSENSPHDDEALCGNNAEKSPRNLCGGLIEYRSEDGALEGVDIHFSDVATPRDNFRSSVSSCGQEGRHGRKRGMLLNAPYGMTDTVLRRSTRRASESSSSQHKIPQAVVPDAVSDPPSSPALSVGSDEKITICGHEVLEDQNVLSPKPELPPSSNSLDLIGLSVPDVFSLYAFLRSFSSVLFLSPFELVNFVASIKCSTPTVLFDSIHLSLLQMLRKHLETLSSEGSQLASKCLRSLNWDLLDMITWPVFMVEYLLMHSSGLKSGFDICRLKLFECDYYKQPTAVKIEILRCLCDDVMESEIIRSELNKRTLMRESNSDLYQNMKFDTLKKRRAAMGVSTGACSTEELGDETADWNSDECYLCKMDGDLICCDGCPAAFHSKCVGIANSLLPEGDWFCPECVIDRKFPLIKMGNSVRGAELLGMDPYGRLYFNCCSYLLVSDSRDDESSFKYYHRNDLSAVMGALKSSEGVYHSLLTSISRLWDVSSVMEVANCTDIPSIAMQHANMFGEGNPGTTTRVRSCSVDLGCEKSVTANPLSKMDILRGAANVSQACIRNQNSKGSGMTDDTERSQKFENGQHHLLEEANLNSPISIDDRPMKLSSGALMSQYQCLDTYTNFYSFARISSAVVEHLARKPSDNKSTKNVLRSEEEVISGQLKAISKKYTDFYWPNIKQLNDGARKEKCGWCYSCRVPECERDCLFLMNDTGPDQEFFSSEALGLSSQNNREGHLIDVICHIICVENRLHGLLLGSWLNSKYPQIWQKSVLKASDVPSLRILLLKLESNLRELALSADWFKHVDSLDILGSACHVVARSMRVSTRHVIMKKKVMRSELESNPSSNAGSGLRILWWRGGRLSRHIFSWKVLPRSLACKAARQGGSKKIPGVLYPDGSDFARRSKSLAWRAAVEASRSVEQLALLVRDLDANIRWNDIENANILSMIDKESQKSIRFFKKAIIRRKCSKGPVVKYLLDFGKRRFIPDVVMKYGSKLEESLSEKKRYWLEETYVPLHLLKIFEEKRIARISSKMTSPKLQELKGIIKKPFKNKGFSYLFSKAKKAENYQCGHCNKGVLISEAVSCSDCKGFFHKRHVKGSGTAFSSECIYTCHMCRDGKHQKNTVKKGNFVSKKNKKASKILRSMCRRTKIRGTKDKQQSQSQNNTKVSVVIPLRRSVRKTKSLQVLEKNAKKKIGCPRTKKMKSRKGTSKKPVEVTRQKKRTKFCRIYWLNGLLLSQKPNDERVELFRRKQLLFLSGELGGTVDSPKCGLCSELESTTSVYYIACEICGDWFHGDAFGLTSERIGSLIGFKCHKCRNKSAPVCAFMFTSSRRVIKLADLSDVKIEYSNMTCIGVKVPSHLQSEYSSLEKHRNSDGGEEAVMVEQWTEAMDVEVQEDPVLSKKDFENSCEVDIDGTGGSCGLVNPKLYQRQIKTPMQN